MCEWLVVMCVPMRITINSAGRAPNVRHTATTARSNNIGSSNERASRPFGFEVATRLASGAAIMVHTGEGL